MALQVPRCANAGNAGSDDQDIGMRLLERIRDELADVAVVENMPKLEGRQMIMVLGPKKK